MNIKRIILLGDFSGVYYNLKLGFEKNGFSTVLISDGDAWKKFPNDINLKYKYIRENFIHKALLQFEKFFLISKVLKNLSLESDDIILIANPIFIPLFGYHHVINFIASRTKNIYLSAMGDDWHYLKFGSRLRYWPYMGQPNILFRRLLYKARDLKLIKTVKKIIPNLYDYYNSYQFGKYSNKLVDSIPFPMSIPKNLQCYQKNRKKLYIFHPINRELFKGSSFIIKALNIIKERYESSVEIIVKGQVSINDFIKILEESDIVIDQCKSYSYGMTALFAMLKGKIVLSGFEKESIHHLHLPENLSFIQNITPNVENIVNALENLINKFLNERTFLEKNCQDSIDFVTKFHNAEDIALKYIKVFNS
jgi:hypothetical protein